MYGAIPGRGVQQAWKALLKMIAEKENVVEFDLQKFYDRIRKRELITTYFWLEVPKELREDIIKISREQPICETDEIAAQEYMCQYFNADLERGSVMKLLLDPENEKALRRRANYKQIVRERPEEAQSWPKTVTDYPVPPEEIEEAPNTDELVEREKWLINWEPKPGDYTKAPKELWEPTKKWAEGVTRGSGPAQGFSTSPLLAILSLLITDWRDWNLKPKTQGIPRLKAEGGELVMFVDDGLVGWNGEMNPEELEKWLDTSVRPEGWEGIGYPEELQVKAREAWTLRENWKRDPGPTNTRKLKPGSPEWIKKGGVFTKKVIKFLGVQLNVETMKMKAWTRSGKRVEFPRNLFDQGVVTLGGKYSRSYAEFPSTWFDRLTKLLIEIWKGEGTKYQEQGRKGGKPKARSWIEKTHGWLGRGNDYQYLMLTRGKHWKEIQHP